MLATVADTDEAVVLDEAAFAGSAAAPDATTTADAKRAMKAFEILLLSIILSPYVLNF